MVSISERVVQYAEQHLARSPPEFFSSTFYSTCSDIVRHGLDVQLSHDLEPDMCTDIYKFLVQNL